MKVESVKMDRPIGDLVPSKANPRGAIDDGELAELAESIRRFGILQPIGVRPKGQGKVDIVFGERRYRAAKLAGLEVVPITFVDADLDLAEVRLVENIQRAQLSPLDEAAAILKMLDDGLELREVARRLGKGLPYVAKRAQLQELSAKIRAKLSAGELGSCSVETLCQLSLLPAQDQDDYMRGEAGPPSAEELRHHVADVTTKLSAAPWKLGDAELDPKAGACTTCTKHSGSRPGLFDEGEEEVDPKAFVCLEADCWAHKLAAWGKRRLAELQEREGKALVYLSGGWRSGRQQSIPLPKGTKVLESWDYVPAKKGAKGAVPGLVVKGTGFGTVRWVTRGRSAGGSSSSSRSKAAADKPEPGSKEDLAAKRARLKSRRQSWVVGDVADRLEAHKLHPGLGATLALAARFGTGHSWRGLWDRWGTVEKALRTPDDAPAFVGELWRAVAHETAKCLRAQNHATGRTTAAKMARTLALQVLGDDALTLTARAAEAVPAPKSLTKPKKKAPAKKKAAKKGKRKAAKKTGRKKVRRKKAARQ